ncbi:hypothetical protein G3A39_38390 [Paraburkholderia aspalathi]|nr:hypothetical protein [Paraburkholderia aspalathi]
MATPTIPQRWIPHTYAKWQEDLSEALADHIENKGLTAGQISKRYSSCRAHHLATLRRGDGETLGLKMLLSLAEATGLKTDLRISV